MGIKSSSSRTFGPYYYFTDYINAFRGSWTSNYKKEKLTLRLLQTIMVFFYALVLLDLFYL